MSEHLAGEADRRTTALTPRPRSHVGRLPRRAPISDIGVIWRNFWPKPLAFFPDISLRCLRSRT